MQYIFSKIFFEEFGCGFAKFKFSVKKNSGAILQKEGVVPLLVRSRPAIPAAAGGGAHLGCPIFQGKDHFFEDQPKKQRKFKNLAAVVYSRKGGGLASYATGFPALKCKPQNMGYNSFW